MAMPYHRPPGHQYWRAEHLLAGRHVSERLFVLIVAVVFMCPVVHIAVSAGDVSTGLEAPPTPPGEQYVYHNYSFMKDVMYEIESQFPEITKIYDIGDTWEKTEGIADRDILAMKISDNVLLDEDEPEVLILALHHAREWVNHEIAIAAISNITAAYGNDARLSWLVDNRETWIVPMVNPDGLDYSLEFESLWRKNRRLNYDGSYGVDLNRNYNGSENGDPAGAWGGAGTSDDPASDVYCGEAPFSEPETRAVRDLALAHDFQIELDFHSSGEWVMWPWGYTANLTADDASLVAIGERLAAINGYTAAQSVDMYATTGDSLDWLYGGAHIYPFLFETATSFQPIKTVDVLAVIDENLPAIWEGIEIAGDRDLKSFDVVHTPVGTRPYASSGFALDAVVTAERGVDPAGVSLVYRVDGGPWAELAMDRPGDNDTYEAEVPAQSAGGYVEYYFIAHDLSGVVKMSPLYAPYEVHSFTVTAVSAPPTADAGADQESLVGQTVFLSGLGSSDDVGIENYTWTFVYDGTDRILYGATPEFTFLIEGVYDVTLTVYDGEGSSDTDSTVVTVSAVPIPELGTFAMAVSVLAVAVLVSWSSAFRRRRREW